MHALIRVFRARLSAHVSGLRGRMDFPERLWVGPGQCRRWHRKSGSHASFWLSFLQFCAYFGFATSAFLLRGTSQPPVLKVVAHHFHGHAELATRMRSRAVAAMAATFGSRFFRVL